ncbi:hypothetical protein GCM10022267_04520 [Lentzea roselyniae]|uniref:Uncharacterized protein n=1 Tax=Lentzea roselyniae TaxID=531940 RepID=A0ABP6ZWF4_9PSEU
MARTLRSFDASLRAAEQRLRDVYAGRPTGDEAQAWAAYFTALADAKSALADVFEAAREVVKPGGIAWSALYDAEKANRYEAEENRRSVGLYVAAELTAVA